MAKINLNTSKERNTPRRSASMKSKQKTPKKSAKKSFKSKLRLQKTPKRKPMPIVVSSGKLKPKAKNRKRKNTTNMPSFLSQCQVLSETTLINISDDEDVTVVNVSKTIAEKAKKEQIDEEKVDDADRTLLVIPDGPIPGKSSDKVEDGILRNEPVVTNKGFVSADYIPLEINNDENEHAKIDELNEVVYISDSEDSILFNKSRKRRTKRWQEPLSEGEISSDSITVLDDTVIENSAVKPRSPSSKSSKKRGKSPRLSPLSKRRKGKVETKEIALSPMPSTSRNRNVLSESNVQGKKSLIDMSALEKLSELNKVLSKIPNLPEFLSQLSKVKPNGGGVEAGETGNMDESDCINLDRTYSSSGQFISHNIFHVEKVKRIGLRPIVIDGSNVAMQHSNGKKFSVKGLKICIDYFRVRGHKVYAFVPSYRMKRNQTTDQKLMMDLVEKRLVYLTSSRDVQGQRICSYDDRILVQAAAAMDAIIVSNDNYRDLVMEDRRLIPTIKRNLLSPTWVGDMIIFPDDPLGRNGPKLKKFLRY